MRTNGEEEKTIIEVLGQEDIHARSEESESEKGASSRCRRKECSEIMQPIDTSEMYKRNM
jgi:hypothetical protein